MVTTPTTTATTPAAVTTAAPTTVAPVSFLDCKTHLDPRLERPMQFMFRARPAANGSQCIFGVDAWDEGSHCIYDRGAYGSNGWCYTKQDKTEWGSCGQDCPRWGDARKLEARIDALTKKVAVERHYAAASSAALVSTRTGRTCFSLLLLLIR